MIVDMQFAYLAVYASSVVG